ncbi:SCO1664 family protein [Gordonia desulfuricans]|uniref:SCO1664 family protein n=1 Tax=Gordonia desulfuricans TaxID=89051 RepID=A0A7K3LMT6_9ACTN|nr:SCO1664 family protein [Gordonia desulfuricans]NDK89371.1 SCO1664 family protein [Gordonia desulfuricans]
MTIGDRVPHDPDESSADATADLAAILRDGELGILGRIPTASNATLVCEATLDDSVVRCVYKPVRGEVPLWDFPDGTLAGREVASFLISDALGWGTVPTTVLRDGPLGIGMVQRWVDTPDPEAEPPRIELVDLCPPEAVPDGYRSILRALDGRGDPVELVHADDPRLQRMAVLDLVLNNADRKGGHVLEGLDGGVYGVDHGICLHGDDKLRTVLWGWAGEPIPAHLIADVERLADDLESPSSRLRADLAHHITADEIDALTMRSIIVAESSTMPTPPPHRPIPWPPF